MITEVLVKSGFPLSLEGEKFKEKFEFGAGLNIIVGQNMCGKTTLLKIMAAASSIKKSGWTHLFDPLDYGKKDLYQYKKIEAEVDWDGTPTLFHNPSDIDVTEYAYFFDSKSDSPDRLSNMQDQLIDMKRHASSGELRCLKIAKYLDALKNPPEFSYEKISKYVNDSWQNAYKKQIDYFNSKPRTGVVTFLMDEPDRNLGPSAQINFWTKIVPEITGTGCQLIISSHSIFALCQKAHYINFYDRPVNEIKDIIIKFFK